eukprot:5840823-Prymnesium_polylepis.2
MHRRTASTSGSTPGGSLTMSHPRRLSGASSSRSPACDIIEGLGDGGAQPRPRTRQALRWLARPMDDERLTLAKCAVTALARNLVASDAPDGSLRRGPPPLAGGCSSVCCTEGVEESLAPVA